MNKRKLNIVQLRKSFWDHHPQFIRKKGLSQNDYDPTIRTSWVDFIDQMHRVNQITDHTAFNATL